MIVFRLCKAKYCRDLSGKGAEKNGGRWNSRGIAVVYTSESRALAVTELAVHTPLSIVPLGIKIVTIEIPDTIPIYQINSSKLPKGWKQATHHPSTKKIGDLWLKNNEHLLMKVPSAVIKGDHNFLINPSHAEFHLIKILKTEEFFFDSRHFKQN
jgi:RES domain-containing protein